MGKYKACDIGTVLPNDFGKYDYKIELPPVQVAEEMRDCSFMPKSGWMARVLYFYPFCAENPVVQGGDVERFRLSAE